MVEVGKDRARTARAGWAKPLLIVLVLLVGLATAKPASAASVDALYTIAGTGVQGSAYDGGPARLADINHPRGLALQADGGLLVVEAFGHRVRRIGPDGIITTVAGSGVAGFSGDGGPATAARLRTPHAVVTLADGGFLIDDANNYRIRRVWPNGTITTVAGTGRKGYTGDGGPATAARISAPRGIDGTPDGTFYLADTDNDRIRRVGTDGTISTVAGTGAAGFSGDGGLATSARLNRPYGVTLLAGGGFVITDTSNNRVRLVDAAGTITTLAGNGLVGSAGDGGPATAAQLNNPSNTTRLPDGSTLVADTLNARVRRVAVDGTISTYAGTGVAGFSGEGAQPTAAQLLTPKAMLVIPAGVVIADGDNQRLRLVGPEPWPAPPPGAGRVEINGNATSTASPRVSVAVPASGARQVRLSSSATTSGGMLSQGVTFAYSTPIAWDMGDTSTGGSSSGGRRLVYAQWSDGSGTWSPVVADSVILSSASPPSVTAPRAVLAPGAALGTSATPVPVALSWTVTDGGAGVAKVELSQSTDGGPFQPVTLPAGVPTATTVSLSPGAAYAFQVRAIDTAGATSPWATGGSFSLQLVQESSPSITYQGAWTAETASTASGGSQSYTADAGASASITFTGTSVAWVAAKVLDRGQADVYVDGARVSTIDQAAKFTPRVLLFAQSWPASGTHTLEVRNLATPGRPLTSVDAFLVGV